jgi:hypothetical protein
MPRREDNSINKVDVKMKPQLLEMPILTETNAEALRNVGDQLLR